jgi:hypothetical protein
MNTLKIAVFALLLVTPAFAMATDSIAQRRVPYAAAPGGEAALGWTILQAGVPEKALREALSYFDENRDKITNDRYLTIIDYSRRNTEERMWVIDLTSGEVEKRLVSHGAGRDERQNPRDVPQYFSNTPDSREGSLGFFLTGTDYPSPKFERALNLHGLEETNSNAYRRRIVMHGAEYVNEAKGEVGRSWGCPAVDNLHAFRLIDQLKDGSLFYITLSEPRSGG